VSGCDSNSQYLRLHEFLYIVLPIFIVETEMWPILQYANRNEPIALIIYYHYCRYCDERRFVVRLSTSATSRFLCDDVIFECRAKNTANSEREEDGMVWLERLRKKAWNSDNIENMHLRFVSYHKDRRRRAFRCRCEFDAPRPFVSEILLLLLLSSSFGRRDRAADVASALSVAGGPLSEKRQQLLRQQPPRGRSYKIVGVPGGTGTQLLPASYVSSFSWWTFCRNRLVPVRTSAVVTTAKNDVDGDSTGSFLGRSSRGVVRIRPALDVLVKGGVPSYVMAGLQCSTFGGNEQGDATEPESSPAAPTETTQEGAAVPALLLLLAEQWTTFATAVEPNFRLAVYRGIADGADARLAFVDSSTVRGTVERLGVLLSESGDRKGKGGDSDGLSEIENSAVLSDGFHIVSVPLAEEWISVVEEEEEEEEEEEGGGNGSGGDILTCFLTAEADIRELFTLDESLVEMTATSFLKVPVRRIFGRDGSDK